MVLYQICVVGADLKSNMAARVHNVFSLAEILKIFLSETTKPIELLLCRNDHWVVLYYTCESFADRKFKMTAIRGLSFNIGPYGIKCLKIFSETSKPI
jgi:hypothetical protein